MVMNVEPYIGKRPLTMEDLQHVSLISDASISADGQYLVYVTTKVVWEENVHKDFISVIALSTGAEIEVWEGSAPQWSPIGNEIAYISNNMEGTYIWIYSLDDGVKRSLVPIYESHYFMGHLCVKGFSWSPCGLQI